MADNAIIVKNVHKAFKLPHEKQNSIKGMFLNIFRGRRSYEKQRVLKDISFEIKQGEFFGIVGRNGSGKSTLLKLLAGIYAPDKGDIHINGKLTPFIELGVGFNPELTGRENVYLNGALLGFNRKEMNELYDEIVEFAELEKFMDQKLKNYSSGMQVRLAFSIAIRAQSEILLLDEVLAVGDEAFQKKCFAYFAQLKTQAQTVILVSHDMESVKRFCDRALMLESGEIMSLGNTAKVAELYTQSNLKSTIANKSKKREGKSSSPASYPLKINALITNEEGEARNTFMQQENILLKVDVAASKDFKPIQNAEVGISLQDGEGKTIFISSTTRQGLKGINFDDARQKHKIQFCFNNVFGEGEYEISVAVLDLVKKETYARSDHEYQISVISKEKAGWLLKPETKVTYLD